MVYLHSFIALAIPVFAWWLTGLVLRAWCPEAREKL